MFSRDINRRGRRLVEAINLSEKEYIENYCKDNYLELLQSWFDDKVMIVIDVNIGALNGEYTKAWYCSDLELPAIAWHQAYSFVSKEYKKDETIKKHDEIINDLFKMNGLIMHGLIR
jgi:hypothetical protein